jgi:5-formyltetrahydrofolate cyclo-ligase
MNKEELRRLMLKKRRDILNKEDLSLIISNKIINLDIYQKAKVIALYNSLKDEVDTKYLISESLKNKIVLLPRIINNKIIFIVINKDTIYTKSNLGIMEPIGEEYLGNIDLIIVPGIAFDNNLNRLGFGMGYYDKYLNNKDIYKIGLCYSNQIISLVPNNELDIKMDMVITNERVYKK